MWEAGEHPHRPGGNRERESFSVGLIFQHDSGDFRCFLTEEVGLVCGDSIGKPVWLLFSSAFATFLPDESVGWANPALPSFPPSLLCYASLPQQTRC